MNSRELRKIVNDNFLPRTRRIIAQYVGVPTERIPSAVIGDDHDFIGDEILHVRDGSIIINPSALQPATDQMIQRDPSIASPVLGIVGSGYDIASGLTAITHYAGGVLVAFDRYDDVNLRNILNLVGDDLRNNPDS
jgi:hypothetical protein